MSPRPLPERTCLICGRCWVTGFMPAPGGEGHVCFDIAACRQRRGPACAAFNLLANNDEQCRRSRPHTGKHVGFLHAWTDDLL